jgi:aminoglycoside phosphotransferase (APT) family kinase protein
VPEPHDNWKLMLLRGDVTPGHVAAFAELLAGVHGAGRARAAETERAFADRSVFESLRLEPYYLYTAGREPEAGPFLRALVEQTRAARDTLVHGDFSPKNVLVRDGRLVLLDLEVVHFGDGAFDVGFALAHLLSKANHVEARRAAFLEGARLFWSTYAERAAGPALSDPWRRRAARHALACLLARVSGRSPLEYLRPEERERQRRAALALMADPPAGIPEVVDAFGARALGETAAAGRIRS